MIRLIVRSLGAVGLTRRRIVVGIGLVAFMWVAFFDSHSLVRRLRWHHEADQIRRANQELRAEIVYLREKVSTGLDAGEIEQIARTQYGMSRPGETVYPIKPEKSH